MGNQVLDRRVNAKRSDKPALPKMVRIHCFHVSNEDKILGVYAYHRCQAGPLSGLPGDDLRIRYNKTLVRRAS
jgi:hypothetical protein